MAQCPANAEVAGVIDGGLGAQGAALLVVLLDAGALVVEMKGRIDLPGEDPGAKAAWRAGGDTPAEDELYGVGAAQVDVVPDGFLKEAAAGQGAVEDLGEADLELEDGKLMSIAGPTVFGGQWLGEYGHPAAEVGLDVVSAELVADLLDTAGIGGGQDAVRSRHEIVSS